MLSVFSATPVITISNSIITIQEDSVSAQLSCTIQTFLSPPVVQYWYKDGQQLFDNRKYDIRFENDELKLIIYNVDQSDQGVYMCFVNNTIIPATANASITFNACKSK